MFQNSFGSQTRRKQKTVVSALRIPIVALFALDLAATSRFAWAEDIDGSSSLTIDSDPTVSDHPSPWDVGGPLNIGVTAGSGAKLTIQNGGEAFVASYLYVASGDDASGSVDVHNGNALADTGDVGVSGGRLLITDNETVGDTALTGGSLEIATGATLFADSFMLRDGAVTGGTLAGSSYILENGSISATLTGPGALTTIGSGTVMLTGTIAAGNSPGTLTIDGDLDLTFASVMDFELGSPSSAAGVDSDLIRLWLNFSDFSLSRDRRTCNA
ncbi:hypothetical protein PsAD5_02825 [Pseudovibrio sp. Ad5]|nr:hypothetical protein PsAD5_02825 [Pseudovibrio sp. Ad5]